MCTLIVMRATDRPLGVGLTDRGHRYRIERKGTTGNGSAVFLTANEVQHAKKASVPAALFLLTQIELKTGGNSISCRGVWVR